MEAQLKSYMTTGVAIVGAGIIAVAPITAMPPDTMVRAATPPTVSLEVEPAGIVEDILADIALLGASGGVASSIILSGLGGVPQYLAQAVVAGVADPGAIPSLLNGLLHAFLAPPGTAFPVPSVLQQLSVPLGQITALLPEPLANLANQVSGGINDLIAAVLGFLPGDASAGFNAIATSELPEIVANVTGGIYALTAGLGDSVQNTLTALGGIPALLAATFGAAVENPSAIPGLISNLVYGVVAPGESLLAGIVDPLVAAVAGIPLVGGLVEGVHDAFFSVIGAALGILPTPIDPTAEVPDAGLNSAGLMAAPLALGDLGDLIPGGLLPGIGDFEAVVEAMSTAVRDFVGGIGQVPELLGNAVRAVVANPMDFGKVLVTVLNGAINDARAGFQPIIAAVLNLLPEVIRTPLNQIGQTLDGAIVKGQAAAQDFVGGPADLSGGAGGGAGAGVLEEKVEAPVNDEGGNGASNADDKAQVESAIQVSNEGGVNDITLTETKVITLDVIPEAKNAAETLKVGAQVSKKPVMNELRTNGPEAPSTTVGGGDTGASLGGDDDGDGDGTGGGLTKGSESGGGTGTGTGTGAGDGGSGGGDDD